MLKISAFLSILLIANPAYSANNFAELPWLVKKEPVVAIVTEDVTTKITTSNIQDNIAPNKKPVDTSIKIISKIEEVSITTVNTLVFQDDTIKLDDIKNNLLIKDAIFFLQEAENNRIQIISYAQTRNSTPSKARQIALKRAIFIRKFLLNKGISRDKIIVKALEITDKKTTDRVEFNRI